MSWQDDVGTPVEWSTSGELRGWISREVLLLGEYFVRRVTRSDNS